MQITLKRPSKRLGNFIWYTGVFLLFSIFVLKLTLVSTQVDENYNCCGTDANISGCEKNERYYDSDPNWDFGAYPRESCMRLRKLNYCKTVDPQVQIIHGKDCLNYNVKYYSIYPFSLILGLIFTLAILKRRV